MPVKLKAPYRFVPLPEQVHYPEWQDIAFDIPHPDGLSGEIELTLTAHSPILVGRERTNDGHVHFYRTPDGQFAIPGNTLRGHIRTLVEMLTHSRLSMMDTDVRHSFRDLTLNEYRKHLTEIIEPPNTNQGHGGTYKPKAQAGWLNPDNWTVAPVQHYRIDYSELANLGIRINQRGREDAPSLYSRWTNNRISLIRFRGSATQHHPHSDGKQLVYAKATIPQQESNDLQTGYLIFTGQPNPRKHMAFIFMPPEGNEDPIPVPPSVRKDFQYIYENSGHWKFLKNLNQQDLPGIPVFYIPDEKGDIRYMGLSQMFRFPYEYKVGDLRPDAHKQAQDNKLDFAELMFGTVDKHAEPARKGRVSFGLLRAVEAEEDAPVSVILNSPKSSFYPTYIQQDPKNNRYLTWNDENARIAGRKLYPPHKEPPQPPTPEADQANVTSHLHPLKEGATFRGKVRFHNLLPQELGVLLLALTLGEAEAEKPICFHTIGMGKPYGFGKSRIQVDQLTVYYQTSPIEIEQTIQTYLKYAEKHFDKGLNTTRSVLLMHVPHTRAELQYMPLEDFAEVKKQARTRPNHPPVIEVLNTNWSKYETLSLFDEKKKRAAQQAQPPKPQKPSAPLPIFDIPPSQITKKDVLAITPEDVEKLSAEWKEKLKKHIELSNWWKNLNSKTKNKNREKLKHIFP